MLKLTISMNTLSVKHLGNGSAKELLSADSCYTVGRGGSKMSRSTTMNKDCSRKWNVCLKQ